MPISFTINQVNTTEDCLNCNKMLEELIRFESKIDNQINDNHIVENFYEKTLNKQDCVIFIAKYLDKPIGYIMAYKHKENPNYNGNFVTIMNLFIKEEYRKLGIGNKLISNVEIWAKTLFGDCFIELDCFIDNKTAIDFYTKQNYKPIRIKMRKKIQD